MVSILCMCVYACEGKKGGRGVTWIKQILFRRKKKIKFFGLSFFAGKQPYDYDLRLIFLNILCIIFLLRLS